MVNLQRGQIWWADLGEPQGSQPGYRRPVLIIQDDHFNESRLATVIILSLTSNLKYRDQPSSVYLAKRDSGLSEDSIINTTQLTTIDKAWLEELVGELAWENMLQVDDALRFVLGL